MIGRREGKGGRIGGGVRKGEVGDREERGGGGGGRRRRDSEVEDSNEQGTEREREREVKKYSWHQWQELSQSKSCTSASQSVQQISHPS